MTRASYPATAHPTPPSLALPSAHWVLIRPDGYIAAIGPGSFDSYLDAVGIQPLETEN